MTMRTDTIPIMEAFDLYKRMNYSPNKYDVKLVGLIGTNVENAKMEIEVTEKKREKSCPETRRMKKNADVEWHTFPLSLVWNDVILHIVKKKYPGKRIIPGKVVNCGMVSDAEISFGVIDD